MGRVFCSGEDAYSGRGMAQCRREGANGGMARERVWVNDEIGRAHV